MVVVKLKLLAGQQLALRIQEIIYQKGNQIQRLFQMLIPQHLLACVIFTQGSSTTEENRTNHVIQDCVCG